MKADTLRIDKLLFFLRLARTRSLAQALVGAGHIRIAGRRVERASHGVAVADVVTMPLGTGVLVFELLALPTRRGPSAEARACYRPLDSATSPDVRPLDDVETFAIAAPDHTEEPTGATGSPRK